MSARADEKAKRLISLVLRDRQRAVLTRVKMLPANRPERVMRPDLAGGWLADFESGFVEISSLSDTMHWLDRRFDAADADFEVWEREREIGR